MSLVDCSKVIVKNTNTMGLGAFANQNIKRGDLIEKGVVKRIDSDGHKSPYLFSWSEDRTLWAFASGCATFYNTSLDPNTRFVRNYITDTFKTYAQRDIKVGEELTHKYKSLEWRECFQELNKTLK